MAIQRQLRRGTKAENDGFTGAIGELVQDTDNDRIVIHNGSTAGGVGVPNFNDLLKDSLVSGTASGTNTYTLTLPYFTPSPQDGQKVKVTFTNANNSASSLNINGTGAVTLAAADGTNFVGGEIEAGGTYVFVYGSSEWRIDDSVGGGGVSYLETQVFTSSGTWSKPSGCAYVEVIVVGGGGGGGAYVTTTATNGASGGTSSFGSHCSATGGEGGYGNVNLTQTVIGGIGSGGDVNVRGGSGNGFPIEVSRYYEAGGGSSYFGGSSYYATSNGAYGAGGNCYISPNSTQNQRGTFGGSSGGASFKTILDADLGSSETVTIGNGGNGGSVAGDGVSGVVIVKAYG